MHWALMYYCLLRKYSLIFDCVWWPHCFLIQFLILIFGLGVLLFQFYFPMTFSVCQPNFFCTCLLILSLSWKINIQLYFFLRWNLHFTNYLLRISNTWSLNLLLFVIPKPVLNIYTCYLFNRFVFPFQTFILISLLMLTYFMLKWFLSMESLILQFVVFYFDLEADLIKHSNELLKYLNIFFKNSVIFTIFL